MNFRLLYEGPIKANGDVSDKQQLRREFHKQLKELISRPPMQPFKQILDMTHLPVRQVGAFKFAPLITETLSLVARLDITVLISDEPGRVITQGGDLDNRLKTLLDGLRAPRTTDEVPKSDSPDSEEDPFYCVFEDDKLISGISIAVDRLLRPLQKPTDVFAIVQVIPESTHSIIGQVIWDRS